MWFRWLWGSDPLSINLLPKVANPGTGASDTGEPSMLLGPGCGDDGAGEDVGLVVLVCLGTSA